MRSFGFWFGAIGCKKSDEARRDHTLWGKCKLYDFGWGKENGFYKEPLPGFDTLLEAGLVWQKQR